MRTYLNIGVPDYISNRYHLAEFPRMAILPFSVPETFAPTGHEGLHFGRELAILFHREFLRTGEIPIVEVFNRDRWPGKRSEFYTGNYQAIQMARSAGYDLVMVGYLEEITNESDLSVFTKIIDTSNGATLWYGKSLVWSKSRSWRRSLASIGFLGVDDRPDLFAFPERAETLASCTVEQLIEGDLVVPADLEEELRENPRQAVRRLPR